MAGIDDAELCVDFGAFYNRQNIALYPLAGYVDAAAPLAFGSNFIDFVDEDNTHLFDPLFCFFHNFIVVDELIELIIHNNRACFFYACRFTLVFTGTHQHTADIRHRVFEVFHVGTAGKDFKTRHSRLLHGNFYHFIFKFAVPQHLAKLFPRFVHIVFGLFAVCYRSAVYSDFPIIFRFRIMFRSGD